MRLKLCAKMSRNICSRLPNWDSRKGESQRAVASAWNVSVVCYSRLLETMHKDLRKGHINHVEMETGENVGTNVAEVKQRLIEIYEVDRGVRTLIYVGRTAKTLEKYVEGMYTFEKVEGMARTKVQEYMYGKGLDKFEFETDGVEYETKREAEAAKAAVLASERPSIDSTMNYNRKKEKTEMEIKKKFVYVHGRMLVFNVDPVKEAQKEEKRKARQKVKEEQENKKQKRVEEKQKREEEKQKRVEEMRKRSEEKQKVIEELQKQNEVKQHVIEETRKYQNDIMKKFIHDMIISESK